MIRDPEQEPVRWSEPIVASSPAEAQTECQKRADDYGLELDSVTQPAKVEGRSQKYECNYKEGE